MNKHGVLQNEKNISSSDQILAVVLLENEIEVSEKLIESVVTGMDISDIEIENNVMTFIIEGEIGFISLMPAPMPWSDLEGPCKTAWYWKDAESVLKNHKAHLLISIMANSPNKLVIERALSITYIVGAVLGHPNALGVLWGPGTVVHSKMNFLKRVHEMNENDIPYELWIEFRIEANNKKCSIISTGMKAFEHMEIEVINSSRKPLEVLSFILMMVDYLIKNGSIIKDGDTVGDDGQLKIKVKYKKSVWNRLSPIMRIEY